MVIKNGITSGYPFVESIHSALPLCDEFLISEGYSNDETYEILVKFFGSNKKVKLFRDEWDRKSVNGSAIRNVLNKVRFRCQSEYVMEIDANEIIPEEDIPFITKIPTMYPKDDLFAFPYYQMLGSKILFTEEFRFRMTKNKKDVKVLDDGNTMGFRYTLMDIFNASTLKRLKGRIVTSVLEGRQISVPVPERYIYLPQPIFRYYSIFPKNFLNKMETKANLQPTKDYSLFNKSKSDSPFILLYKQYVEDGNYESFWEKMYDLHVDLFGSGKVINKKFNEKRIIDEALQPNIIRPQFGKSEYFPLYE
jgi:hypothetical protein